MDKKDIPAGDADPEAAPAQDRKKTFARRALIQAGWAIPAAAMIAMPKSAGAASAHGDTMGFTTGPPGGHADAAGGLFGPPVHGDTSGGHSDAAPHLDFPYALHSDGPNQAHFDNGVIVGPPHIDG